MVWLRYGQEVGEANHVPHLQGCVMFKNPIEGPNNMATKIGDWVKNCHWEWMKGSISANVKYTGKDASEAAGTLHEFGERPLTNAERRKKGGEATKEKYLEIIAKAKEGDMDWIEMNHPGEYLRMKRTLKEIAHESMAKKQKTEHNELDNWWIFGETGCGKSRAVHDAIPIGRMYKKMQNKWWDGYMGQDYILIDDFDPGWTGKAALKQWSDHYMTKVETKGGTIDINPKHFIITSNYKIEECEFREQDVGPIRRRFKCVNVQAFKDLFKLSDIE